MRRAATLASALGALTLLSGLTAMPAQAGEAVMFRDRVPSPTELANLLWPQPAAAPAGVRTRAIRLDADAGAAAPAAPVSAAAGVQQVVADVAVAPRQPERQRPVKTATGFGFDIRFAFDSTEVLPESLSYLDQVGTMLQSAQAQGQPVAILGHTDATGSDGYNAGLSQRRAVAVAQYLVSRYGVTPDRLQVAGLGEGKPLAGKDPEDPANRRVEFHAVQ